MHFPSLIYKTGSRLYEKGFNRETQLKVDMLQVTKGPLSLTRDFQIPFLVHGESYMSQLFEKINYGYDLVF